MNLLGLGDAGSREKRAWMSALAPIGSLASVGVIGLVYALVDHAALAREFGLEARDHALQSRMIGYGLDSLIANDVRLLLGQIAARQTPATVDSLQEAEFRVFSQFNEDGIVQFLVKYLKPKSRRFIEFGVQHYVESNTRFLLEHNSWTGLVMDNSQTYIDFIREKFPGWRHNLVAKRAQITKDNVNELFEDAGFTGNIGLLSIDIDSCDYYIWKAVSIVSADIISIEYNRNFPIDRPIVIPYEDYFDRSEKHPSKRYWGASLSALNHLAQAKGYVFVGAESHQRNAFFVRKDLAAGLPVEVPDQRHVHASAQETLEILAGMPVYNAVTDSMEVI